MPESHLPIVPCSCQALSKPGPKTGGEALLPFGGRMFRPGSRMPFIWLTFERSGGKGDKVLRGKERRSGSPAVKRNRLFSPIQSSARISPRQIGTWPICIVTESRPVCQTGTSAPDHRSRGPGRWKECEGRSRQWAWTCDEKTGSAWHCRRQDNAGSRPCRPRSPPANENPFP